MDRSRATGPAVPVRRQGQAQDRAAHVQDGLERLLGRAADELERRAGAREPELRPQHRRPRATSSSTTARTSTWSSSTQGDASYWVVNTLLDRLSNETMLAIAKGLRPVAKVRALAGSGDPRCPRPVPSDRRGRPLLHASRSSAPGTSASSRAPASPSSATRSSSATSSPIGSRPSSAARCRSTSPGWPS